MIITPGRIRRWIYKVSTLCIIINFGVKLGLIYSFQNKTILLVGAIIDMIGVLLVARLSKPY